MLQLIEIVPLVIFFIVFKFFGLHAAIGSMIISMSATMVVAKLNGKNPSKMQLVSYALLVIFGGASLLFQNDMFLKWKPSVLNFACAIAFFGSQFIGKKTIAERIAVVANLQQHAPAKTWKVLNLVWVLFFILLGSLNLYVAYTYSTEAWVNFKVFGLFGLTLIFVVGQAIYLSKIKQD